MSNPLIWGSLLVGVAAFFATFTWYMSRPKVTARRGLAGLLFGSGRSPAWNRADHDYKAAHPNCEFCGIKGGPLGGLDGSEGVQATIEAHDKLPYHKLTDAQKNDYNFIYGNLISLHHFEHHHIAHLGDPNCYKYLPNIAEVAAYVLASTKGGTT